MDYVLGIGLGMPEMLLVLGVVLLIFGGSRLPQLAKGLGSSVREFKRGVAGQDEARALREDASEAGSRLD